MILVQDTKRPNKDPFEISEKGYEGLKREYGDRYQQLSKVIVTPDKIEVTKKDFVTPAKTKEGK